MARKIDLKQCRIVVAKDHRMSDDEVRELDSILEAEREKIRGGMPVDIEVLEWTPGQGLALIRAMQAYLSGLPSRPPVTGLPKRRLVDN